MTLALHCAGRSAGVGAALTFILAYKEIAQAGGESWVSYLHAFQNGFFYPLHFAAGVLRDPPHSTSGMLRAEAALDALGIELIASCRSNLIDFQLFQWAQSE